MTDKEKLTAIKAEIERLKKENNDEYDSYDFARLSVLEQLDELINSMQEEPASKDLEEEIEWYMTNVFSEDTCMDAIARHFANWQKQQDKRELNETRIIEYERGLHHGRDDIKQQMMKVWHNINEKADGSKFVVLYDVDGGYMSPPSRSIFGFDSMFIRSMNKKYGANYTMWAYRDDLVPNKKED